MSTPIATYSATIDLETILTGRDLSAQAAADFMTAVIDGRVAPATLAAMAIALRMKGESAAEIAAFAAIMRKRATRVNAPDCTLDTCGTGGDKSDTFNISTATAFVVAGMGIPVAKHGGGSVSSKTGSADVLKALGVCVVATPARVERCINEAGIGFMFAPAFHPGLKHAAAVRKELGVRTIFNLLGPLASPAAARLQLLGVYDPALCEKFAEVLKLLGSRCAMIVCGAGPGENGYLDEVSTFGPSTIAWLKDGAITMEQFHPESLGLARASGNGLSAADAEASAKIIHAVLNERQKKSPARDIVVLNAAAAARVAGRAAEWRDGLRQANESIDSGRAATALMKLIAISTEETP